MLNFAKKIYERSPSLIKKIAWAFPQPFTLSPKYLKTKKILTEFKNYEPNIITKIQSDLLAKQLIFCIRTVPFYKFFFKQHITENDIYNDPYSILKEFPIITKENIEENIKLFLSTDHNSKTMFMTTTGGSTGKPVHVYLSNATWAKEWAFVYNLLQNYGVKTWDKRISFRGVRKLDANNNIYEENPIYREIRISPFHLSKIHIKKIKEIIYNSNAHYIHGYPSAIRELLTLIGDESQKIFKKFKVILLVSENLKEEEIKNINKLTGCPVASFYGHTERLCFAPWSHKKRLWIPNSLYGVTEIIDSKIIATGFINSAMPLIRYNTEDYVISDNQNVLLSPGEGFISIEGRWNHDYLVGKNNQKITMTALNTHIPEMALINKFQFFQEKKGEAILKLKISSENVDYKSIKNIKKEFEDKCSGELKIIPIIVDDIPLSRIGKHKFIVKSKDI